MSSSKKSSVTNSNCKLFARLSLLMGLTWVVGFIADYLDLEAVWFIYVALNAFQVSIVYTIQSDQRGKINNLGRDTIGYCEEIVPMNMRLNSQWLLR